LTPWTSSAVEFILNNAERRTVCRHTADVCLFDKKEVIKQAEECRDGKEETAKICENVMTVSNMLLETL
jgi:hypothetical protein